VIDGLRLLTLNARRVSIAARMSNPQTGPDAYQRQMTTVEIEHHLIVCFRREAARRDVPVKSLIDDLLDVIVADGLTAAILDDGDVSS
jgi:hypothetical protein